MGSGILLVPGLDIFRRPRIFKNVVRNVNNKLDLKFFIFSIDKCITFIIILVT